MKTVSAELIAIIATGAALAGLMLVSQHRLEDRLLAVEKEQARFRMFHAGVEFTAHTHDTKPDHQ